MPPRQQKDASRLITYGKQTRNNKRRRVDIDPTQDELGDMSSWVPAHHQPQPLKPKLPPASQKAASMTVEPDAASVQTVVEWVGIDANLAARYLRVKQNNIEAAVNAIYEGESIDKLESSSTWDDSLFNTDREGNTLHPLGSSAAPTRQPSPAASLGVTNPKTKADEERELAAALAASQHDLSGTPFHQQESGVVTQDGRDVRFGPATREQYDANQWALVPTYSAALEVVPDVPAKERIQHGSEPRLLKHLPDGDYTPNLLTICHAIPKAREAFLMRHYLKSDYGHDSDWWRGHSIPIPRIVHVEDGSAAQPESDKYDELIAETQRLITFLDLSDRVYATIGGITNADVIKNNNLQMTKSGSLLELFLQNWVIAATSIMGDDQGAAEQIAGLFTTAVGTSARQSLSTPDMTVIDMFIKADDGGKDLSELLDGLLWDTDPTDTDQPDNYIEHPADILVMKVMRPNAPLNLDVPPSLYLDKYLQENVAATKVVRQRMTQGKKRLKKIEQIENDLTYWRPGTNISEQIDARKMLQHTLGHFSGQNRKDADDADKTNNASLVDHEPLHYAGVAHQLEQVLSSIDKKLSQLAEEKEKTSQAIAELSKVAPPELQQSEQKHRYTLRGVATKPSITYVLRPKADDDGTDMVNEESTPEGYQWWRLEYEVSGSSARLHRTKAGDYDVLRAAELEHNSALLVYASDEATDLDAYFNEDVPQPLRDFVSRDNDDFASELANEHPNPPAYRDSVVNISDIPRSIEHRGSLDSLNVVNDEHSPPGYDDNPSQHHAYGLGYGPKDPPVAEIHLDDVGVLNGASKSRKEMEMMENKHAPLVPRPPTGSATATNDTVMSGAESQDLGVGGSAHPEDPDMQ